MKRTGIRVRQSLRDMQRLPSVCALSAHGIDSDRRPCILQILKKSPLPQGRMGSLSMQSMMDATLNGISHTKLKKKV